MRGLALALVPILCLLAAPASRAQESMERVVRGFLPPGASLSQFVSSSPATGKVISRSPAFLTGHIVSANSVDVVFAYETRAADLPAKSLFIGLLHRTKSGYVEVSQVAYYGRYLWGEDFRTVGLQLVPLPGTGRDGVVIAAAVGASLGASVQVFSWDSTLGLQNVFPENSGAHSIRIRKDSHSLVFELGFSKYPGEPGAPAPLVFRWTGHRFSEAP